MQAGQHVFERGKCVACGECVEQCHAGALDCIGREVTSAEVLATVLRDVPFYEHSGGGLTVSGGEPLLQLEFTLALLRGAKAAGLLCAGIARLAYELPRLIGVEIMPYHRLGLGKQQRLGLAEPLPDTPAPTDDTVAGWAATLRQLGVNVIPRLGSAKI